MRRALVTGGAGFIGSNLVNHLVACGDSVRVLDDLSTGSFDNIRDVEPWIEFVVADIRDLDKVERAVQDVDVVFHLAALPSVPRSMGDPAASHAANATGTLNVLQAARNAEVRRLVYASSSSVYGDAPTLPKHEDLPVAPRSPYAASKLAGEAQARAFAPAFGLETVSLRFFNVFGPRQDPASQYAAVIPRFATRMLAGERPVIFGDGKQSRDFTYVANAVQACVLAAEAGPEASGEVVNIACGRRITLMELVASMNEILGTSIHPQFAPPRTGDVQHSLAAVEKAERLIGYRPLVGVEDGLRLTLTWLRQPNDAAPDPALNGSLQHARSAVRVKD